MRGEHAQALCVKDAFIEGLTSDFANERAQLYNYLKSERATVHDVSERLRLALKHKIKDANDKALIHSLRAENIQLLTKLAQAAGEASEAQSRADERRLEVTRLDADFAAAVRLQLSAQTAELDARRDQCSLREQLLQLRSQLNSPGSPAPTAGAPAHVGLADPSPSIRGSPSQHGFGLGPHPSVSPFRGSLGHEDLSFLHHHGSCTLEDSLRLLSELFSTGQCLVLQTPPRRTVNLARAALRPPSQRYISHPRTGLPLRY
jgi:hypothetical protein